VSDTATAANSAAPEGTPAEGSAPEGNEGTQEVQETGKTFTQADLDRIVAERLARESKKYADYDDLKAKVAALDEAKEATTSEADKAIEAARKEVEDNLRAEFARERVTDKVDALAAGKFADVEDARLRLAPRVDEFIKDGAVDIDAITKALDEVLDKHPHLAAQPVKKTPSASRAGIGTAGTGSKAPQVSPGIDRLRSAYADKA
jgi:type I site-specific restriction endonuclease